MTDTEKLFLNLIKSYVSDATPELSLDGANFGELIKLSEMHKLTPLIYAALKKNSICFSDAKNSYLKKRALSACSAVISKGEAFSTLLSHLSAQGLEPITVKGSVLRAIYPETWVRPSSDEDIYIEEKEKEKYEAAFLSLGFEKQPQNAGDGNVTTFLSAKSSLRIEMHVCLFPHHPATYEKMNSFFENSFINSTYALVDGRKVKTLNPTEHLLFLIFHSLKHFIYYGFGVRQVTDFALFSNRHSDEIDENYVISALGEIKALVFFDALLKICDEYLGFDKNSLGFSNYTPSDVSTEEILNDILSGGIYGNANPARVHASTITLAAVDGKKGNFLSALFPSYEMMRNRFSYLEKYPFLLPVSWLKRIFGYIFSKERKSGIESLEIGAKRLSMLEQYGIIEGGRHGL